MPFLAMAAMTSGCATQEVSLTAVDQSLAQQLSSNSQYMKRTFAAQGKGVGISGAINLADPAQYRFVTDRLTAAGKSAANSPELFTRLQQSKNKAIAAQAKTGGISNAATSTDWCAGFILPGTEVRSGSSVIFNNMHPVVSCHGGSAYVYVDLYTFNQNVAGTESLYVASTYGEDYSGAIVFDSVTLSPALPATLGRVNYTDSYAISYDAAGLEQYTYFAIASGVVPVPAAPASIALAHPMLHSWISNGGSIEMCQLRGSPTQCDYAVGNLTSGVFTGWATNASGIFTGIAGVATNTGTATVPWAGDTTSYVAFPAPYDGSHLYLPTVGTLDVGATDVGGCSIVSINSAAFNLLKATTGGTCSTSASFASSITFPANSRTASFRTITDFTNDGGTANPPSANCSLSAIINEGVKPALLIRATANCGGVTIPRIAAIAPGGGPALPQLVFFLNSCFPAGTDIRRADGSSVAVETIKAGDKVISNDKGTVLTVTGISHGGEDEPLVQLRDNKGHELQLTAKHPLIKASGEVVAASAINKDDRVMTDRGIASIVSVTRIPYTGQVYNLKLGTPEEQLKVGKDGTTMFAGGFRVGDSVMQQEHDTPRRAVAQLNKAWQRDYQNATARTSPTRSALR